MKTLVWLELGDWEFYQWDKCFAWTWKNDPNRASETLFTQTQTSMEKIDLEEKMAIPSPTWLIKSPTKTLPVKQDQKIKDPQYSHQLLQTPLQTKKKTFKDKQKKKHKSETIEPTNKFKLLEKMETESSPQLTKPQKINQKTAWSKGLIMNHQITLWNSPDQIQ